MTPHQETLASLLLMQVEEENHREANLNIQLQKATYGAAAVEIVAKPEQRTVIGIVGQGALLGAAGLHQKKAEEIVDTVYEDIRKAIPHTHFIDTGTAPSILRSVRHNAGLLDFINTTCSDAQRAMFAQPLKLSKKAKAKLKRKS